MCLRLFDKKHREFGVVGFFQFYSDCRNVEKIRKSVTGVPKVLGCYAEIGKLEPKVTRDIDELLIRIETKGCALPTDTSGEYVQTCSDGSINIR